VIARGGPNAGKSSLLNALAGFDAAIVTENPGHVARPPAGAQIHIDGLTPSTVVDTAGAFVTPTTVLEIEGLRRARMEMSRAELSCCTSSTRRAATARGESARNWGRRGRRHSSSYGNQGGPARSASLCRHAEVRPAIAVLGPERASGPWPELRDQLKPRRRYQSPPDGSAWSGAAPPRSMRWRVRKSLVEARRA
jgi:hypothetical protein